MPVLLNFAVIPCYDTGSYDIEILPIFRKAFAFTLAETLIVMGIIGVVAALTIPNLNSSTADKEKVAKVMKVYSNLKDAFGRAEAVYGSVDEWFSGDANATAQATRAGERLSEFLKVSKNCGVTTNGKCFGAGQNILYLNGTVTSVNYDTSATNYKLVLADGSSLAVQVSSNVLLFNMNIDGSTKASKLGKNTFKFRADHESGVTSNPANATISGATFKSRCFKTGEMCTYWVVNYGNMDYLKVSEDGKCPNGKTILDGTNTTCK